MSFFTVPQTDAFLRSRKHIHVALIVETSNEYARGLLRGIKSYIREHKPWSIYLGEQSRGHIDLSWLKDWQGNGIIARIETPEIAEAVQSLGVPTVDLSAGRWLPGLPCVETNNESIARMAAQHLLERGFKQFGYAEIRISPGPISARLTSLKRSGKRVFHATFMNPDIPNPGCTTAKVLQSGWDHCLNQSGLWLATIF